jgi:hypothetical protein
MVGGSAARACSGGIIEGWPELHSGARALLQVAMEVNELTANPFLVAVEHGRH